MKYHLLCLCLIPLVVTSCAVKRPPVAPGKPGVVTVAPPVTPQLLTTNESLTGVIISNRILSHQNTQLQKDAASAREAAKAAKDELEKIRKQEGVVTKEQLDDLWNKMTVVEARNLFLETQIVESGKKISDQESELLKTQTNLLKALTAAEQKDSEAKALRISNEVLGDQVDTWSKRAEALEKEANDWKGKYEGAKPYKTWCIVLGVIALLLVVLSIVLRRILPYVPKRPGT